MKLWNETCMRRSHFFDIGTGFRYNQIISMFEEK